MARSLSAFAVAALPVLLCAQTPNDAAAKAQVQDLQDFGAWLKDYRAGAFRVVKDGKLDDAALQKVDERMAKLAQWNTLAVGKLLFEASSVDPHPPDAKAGSELIDFHREVQPWRIQALACKHLRAMTADGLLAWLLGMLDSKNLRSKDGTAEQRNVAAVLRVLAGHPSLEAKLALQRACQALP